MKKYFVALTLIAFVWSCSPKTTPTTTTTTPAPAKPSGDVAAGKETYEAKCGRCHGLPNPGDFTATKWPHIIDEMAPKAKLDGTETANVLAYVLANAKQ
ncbi:c-type cytochrome [Ferruginibacter albus]|uniref:c-type cytochrome n=1 Tax=Ferruginibacter albus TaxID=2875540 RepID=UPI001CC6C364|nr:cytochrome c [Ferruginibacter albus]UAY52343.1 cytochrome c [Ferruginibacter albus]